MIRKIWRMIVDILESTGADLNRRPPRCGDDTCYDEHGGPL